MSANYRSILDLGLALAGYVHGALLAGFFIAFLPLKVNGRGLMFSGPLSVMCVFAIVWHEPWAHTVCRLATILLLAFWLRRSRFSAPVNIRRTLILIAGLALMLWLTYYGFFEDVSAETGRKTTASLSWPWYTPAGSLVAFIWGYLLAGRENPPQDSPCPAAG